MSDAHPINLGNAWEAERGDVGHAPAWVRRFGRPAGLAAADAVWLVIDAPAAATLSLNGAALPAPADGVAYRVDVTALLRDRNLLLLVPRDAGLTVGSPTARSSLPTSLGRVRLEILSRGG